MANFGQFFTGAPGRVEQVSPYSKQQQPAFQQLLNMGLQGLQNPTRGFEPIEQHARTQFQQQTVPSLAERFTSMGKNSLSSGAFATQIGQAGSGLEEALASLKAQYGLQNQGQQLNLAQLGLTPQYENIPMAAQPGFLQNTIGTAADAGIRALMGYFTGGGSELGNILKLLSGVIGGGNSGNTFGNQNFSQRFGQMSQNSY
jgi:hypothetical protein